MSQAQIEIQLVAMVVAAACALPGVFLILRRMAMMSDAISHSILFGIVVAFFIVKDLASPLLIIGAALTGLLTVVAVELLQRSGRVREDSAIGLVFPVLFSIGVIMIARQAGQVHLDTDAVLLGELAFAPFDRLVIGGLDCGPKSLAVMLAILALNLSFIAVFYKELKVATFDAALAGAMGMAPALLHYLLMGLVSVTAVGAFNAVGSILVVALMISPPATAYLLTDRLSRMLGLSVLIGAVTAIAGYWIAHFLDASIAGSMAAVSGLVFAGAFLAAPRHGLLAGLRRRVRQRRRFAEAMLAIHIFSHENSPNAAIECHVDHLSEHLRWERQYAGSVVRNSTTDGLVRNDQGRLHLTASGRALAQEWLVQ